MNFQDLSWITKLAGMLIPLAGIVLPAVLLYIALRFRESRYQQLLDTVKHFAERGMPVPRELMDPPRRNIPTLFYFACTFVGTGVGLAIMFYTLELPLLTGIGGLLVCIGGAQLVALKLESKQPEAQPPQAS